MKRTIFFTSDLHFGHDKVIAYSKRPFNSLEEMHAKLIKNWNNTIKAHDVVYVLGDWSMYMKKEDLRNIMSKLNGTKILIRGNHDMSPHEMIGVGFSACLESAEVRIGKTEKVLLSHYPYKNPYLVDLYYNIMYKLFPNRYYNPRSFINQLKDNGMWLLHGHTHSKAVKNGRMIHVGIDAWGYRPVSEHTILNLIRG